MKRLNPIYHLEVSDIRKAMERDFALIDLRDAACFGGAHIPGSINIGMAPSSPSWLADVVDPERHLVLIATDEAEVREAVTMFRRVGYDNIYGYCVGIMSWVLAGEETGFLPQVSIHGLHRILEKYPNHTLLDVRTREEWEEGHIEQALHLPIHDLLEEEGIQHLPKDKDAHLSVICKSGYRSNIAASYLKSKGYTNVYSVIGGMSAWMKRFDTV